MTLIIIMVCVFFQVRFIPQKLRIQMLICFQMFNTVWQLFGGNFGFIVPDFKMAPRHLATQNTRPSLIKKKKIIILIIIIDWVHSGRWSVFDNWQLLQSFIIVVHTFLGHWGGKLVNWFYSPLVHFHCSHQRRFRTSLIFAAGLKTNKKTVVFAI